MVTGDVVGPAEEDLEIGRRGGGLRAGAAQHHLPAGAIDRDHFAFAHHAATGDELIVSDLDAGGTHDGRDAPPPRDDGRVADQSPPGR